jgi:anaerobic magnesium-protoporphyrin IX monomethyl ester cyclase
MKNLIYLINPSEKRILDNAGDRVPYGLMSISSNLKKHGYDVKLWDMNHESEKELYHSFNKDKPLAVGISVYTSPGVPEAKRLIPIFRNKTRLIAGGYHATAMPETLPEFDAIVRGEGELGMLEALTKNGIINAKRPKLSELDIPDRESIKGNRYGIGKQATIITSRGCPFNCSFCFNLSRNVRAYTPNQVSEQIRQIKEEGFESLYFLDDVFTINKPRMEEIIKFVDMPFRFTTRANLIDEERIYKLEKRGATEMSLGIESGNDEILKKSQKAMTTRQNEAAVMLANRYGITTKGFFIIGLPGETEKTAKQTIDFSLKLRDKGLHKADFYALMPFPGTPIWNNPEKFGIEIINQDYTKYLEAGKEEVEVFHNTEFLKAQDIKELIIEAKERWK